MLSSLLLIRQAIALESLIPRTGEDGTNPTELVSVETGLCTTSSVVQKPKNHRDKLGGVCVNVPRVRLNDSPHSELSHARTS